jgi:tRNA(Ile)-lysidine synthase TilS/MesJ
MKKREDVRRCKRCVLPETFPGITFDEEGICSYCRKFKGRENLEEKKYKYRNRFEDLLNIYKGKSGYDALMCYSGGKDSTYVLSLLGELYGLNVYAVTYDNGFLPQQTIANIQKVTDKLGMDHMLFRPRFDVMRKIFAACAEENIYPAQTLIRASTICTSCMAIVKFSALRTALEMDIPFIVFGWSPGQIPVASAIMKNNAQIIQVMQKAVFEPLHGVAGDRIRPYFLEDKHFEKGRYDYPYNLSPLAFLDYDEERIFEKVRSLGWKRPKGIDANTTNCLLNSFANVVHKRKYGFHPYAFETAKLVREGYMDRKEALSKLKEREDPETVDHARKKLGVVP